RSIRDRLECDQGSASAGSEVRTDPRRHQCCRTAPRQPLYVRAGRGLAAARRQREHVRVPGVGPPAARSDRPGKPGSKYRALVPGGDENDRGERLERPRHLELETVLTWPDLLNAPGPDETMSLVKIFRMRVAIRHPKDELLVAGIDGPCHSRQNKRVTLPCAACPALNPAR